MPEVLRLSNFDQQELTNLLRRYGLSLALVPENHAIPGSYWGDDEAGLVENRLFARQDTPLHSILHEACHYICVDNLRRSNLNTDAKSDNAEENAVCYLQILMADHLPSMGRDRMYADMDAWHYSFRLGSAHAWFEQDAEEAYAWLLSHAVIDDQHHLSFRVRHNS